MASAWPACRCSTTALAPAASWACPKHPSQWRCAKRPPGSRRMATVDWVRGPEPGTASLDQGPRTLDPGQAAAQAAMQQAIAWLLGHQDAEGWWCGELEANVTIQAEYILLMQFLGLRDDDRWAEIVQYINRRQQEDGGWPIYYDGPSDLSTTIEAYLALKLTGRDPSDPRMRRALNLVRSLGGLPKARIFTKLWLALFGEYPWEGTPVMPPELMFLPPSVPLNIYDFSRSARGTIVPLLIVMTLKPVRPLPDYARAPELREGFTPEDFALPKPKNPFGWRGAFYALDQALRKFPWPKPTPRHSPSRAVGAGSPGGRRQLGRHPAAVGLLPPGAEHSGIRERASGHQAL